jgi:hypothetical protein
MPPFKWSDLIQYKWSYTWTHVWQEKCTHVHWGNSTGTQSKETIWMLGIFFEIIKNELILIYFLIWLSTSEVTPVHMCTFCLPSKCPGGISLVSRCNFTFTVSNLTIWKVAFIFSIIKKTIPSIQMVSFDWVPVESPQCTCVHSSSHICVQV